MAYSLNNSVALSLLLVWLGYFPAAAQNEAQYIDASNPVIESMSPSRDGRNIYHFYYTFNWTTETVGSVFNRTRNPQISRLEIYEFGQREPFRTYNPIPGNPSNQIEFQVRKSDLGNRDQIQYAVKWEVDDENGTRLVKLTEPKTLRINFRTDPALQLDISKDDIYYVDDINKPSIKIKTNGGFASFENLTLRMDNSPTSTVVAEVLENKIINPTEYTELNFSSTGEAPLTSSRTYYLYGNFKNGDLQTSIPLPNVDNSYKIHKKERFTFLPDPDFGYKINVQGQQDKEVTLVGTGEASNLKASLRLGNNGTKDLKLEPLRGQRWKLIIPGDSSIPFGTYNVEFSGVGANGEPMKPTVFFYAKEPIKRNIIQMEYADKVYKATAEFSEKPSGEVYLVIDNFDVMMSPSPADPKKYHVSFSLSDETLQSLSNQIKDQPDHQKRVLITTKVDGLKDNSLLAKDAMVIDTQELEGKNRNEIKNYLKNIGFQENIDELAKNISNELKKERTDRNWNSNVWSSAVEWAPKAISLILMLI